jgi:hypothetical protein
LVGVAHLTQPEGLKKKEEQRLKELERLKKRKGKGQAGRGGGAQQRGAGRGDPRGERGPLPKPSALRSGQVEEAAAADGEVAATAKQQGPIQSGHVTEQTKAGADSDSLQEPDATDETEGQDEEEDQVVAGGENAQELEAKRKRRQEKRHEKKKEAEEIRQIMEEENIKPLDESLLSEIDALTGTRARVTLESATCLAADDTDRGWANLPQAYRWPKMRSCLRFRSARPTRLCRTTSTRSSSYRVQSSAARYA